MRAELDAKLIAPHVLDAVDEMLSLMARRAVHVKDPRERVILRAAQAVAVIALSDQFLASMPVEVGFMYRQLAKDFNTQLEEKWEKLPSAPPHASPPLRTRHRKKRTR